MQKRTLFSITAVVLIILFILIYPLIFSGVSSIIGKLSAQGVLTVLSDNDTSEPDTTSPPVSDSEIPTTTVKKIAIDHDVLLINLVQDDVSSRVIEIKNEGNKDITITLSEEDPEDLISLPYTSKELKAGEEALITIDLTASAQKTPGTYMSRVIIDDGTSEKIITLIITVARSDSLFDVDFKIKNPNKTANTGDSLDISAIITTFEEDADITLSIQIKDLSGKTVEEYIETFTVNKELSIDKNIEIPWNLESGDYILVYIVIYEEGRHAVSSDLFEIVGVAPENPVLRAAYFLRGRDLIFHASLISIVIISFLTIIYIQYRRDKKEEIEITRKGPTLSFAKRVMQYITGPFVRSRHKRENKKVFSVQPKITKRTNISQTSPKKSKFRFFRINQ